MAAVIESWPQPAHSVDIDALVVADGEPELVGLRGCGWATAAFGEGMASSSLQLSCVMPSIDVARADSGKPP